MRMKEGDVITAIDPGGTTGVTQLRYKGAKDFEIICCVEVPWDRRFKLRDFVLGSDHIVIERFALYESHAKQMINNEFPSVRIIGIVEAYANELDLIGQMTFQPAQAMQSVLVLPEHVAFTKGSEHKKDSYKHGRYYIVMNAGLST
jgi:hypothetical protein